jgi:hypothetical protein
MIFFVSSALPSIFVSFFPYVPLSPTQHSPVFQSHCFHLPVLSSLLSHIIPFAFVSLLPSLRSTSLQKRDNEEIKPRYVLCYLNVFCEVQASVNRAQGNVKHEAALYVIHSTLHQNVQSLHIFPAASLKHISMYSKSSTYTDSSYVDS